VSLLVLLPLRRACGVDHCALPRNEVAVFTGASCLVVLLEDDNVDVRDLDPVRDAVLALTEVVGEKVLANLVPRVIPTLLLLFLWVMLALLVTLRLSTNVSVWDSDSTPDSVAELNDGVMLMVHDSVTVLDAAGASCSVVLRHVGEVLLLVDVVGLELARDALCKLAEVVWETVLADCVPPGNVDVNDLDAVRDAVLALTEVVGETAVSRLGVAENSSEGTALVADSEVTDGDDENDEDDDIAIDVLSVKATFERFKFVTDTTLFPLIASTTLELRFNASPVNVLLPRPVVLITSDASSFTVAITPLLELLPALTQYLPLRGHTTMPAPPLKFKIFWETMFD
jgi:hypothetical protein